MDENWDFLCAEKKELHSCPIKKKSYTDVQVAT